MARLFIEMGDAKIDVEGSEDLLREVYADFRERLTTAPKKNAPRPIPRVPRMPRPKTGPLIRPGTLPGLSKKPELDNSLKLDGLAKALDKVGPKTQAEQILFFAMYLRDEKKISPCTVNQINTCFWTVRRKIKTPSNLNRAILDTANKKKWIDIDASGQVMILAVGESVFRGAVKG